MLLQLEFKMTNQHLITPPSELVQQWIDEEGGFTAEHIATRGARWGAEQELHAICHWLDHGHTGYLIDPLLRTRRPKPQPPTMRDQALEILATAGGPDYPTQMTVLNTDQHILIRRALEALPQ
jgi:hypothetical protein